MAVYKAENHTTNPIVLAPTPKLNKDGSHLGWNDDGFTIPAATRDPKDSRRTIPGVLEIDGDERRDKLRARLGKALDDRDLRILGG